MKINPLVSVIITTKNSQDFIEDCLLSIENQTYKNIEIIVVDNNSIDNTKKIAKKHTAKVFNKGPERSAQKNFGAKMSRGEYLLFLDSDMSLSKNVIKECINKFEGQKSIKSNLLALYIPEVVIGNSFWCHVRNFERSFYNATVIDAVRFIRKKGFLTVGGFDQSIWGGEDWDLDKRLKQQGRFEIITAPLYHNDQDFSIYSYLRKKAYYIKSFDRYINKWGRNDLDIKKQLGFYYRYFGVFIEHGKWKKLLTHPHLVLATLFLKVTVGFTYLLTKFRLLK